MNGDIPEERTAVAVGDFVLILEIPDSFTKDLPIEDQHAVRSQVGKTHRVDGFGVDGTLEISFLDEDSTDEHLHTHTIWVAPHWVKVVS